MKPFIIIQTREQEAIKEDEFTAILRLGGLEESQVKRLCLDQHPLPELNLDHFSGIILGGSPFSFSTPNQKKSELQRRVENDLKKLMEQVAQQDFPFLGACYGIGTLGGYHGGIISTRYGEEISAPWITLTEAGKADPLFANFPTRFQAYVGHKEACEKLPEKAVLLAKGQACPIQAFRIGQNMYGTQFHPELDWPGLHKRIITYQHAGYYPLDEQARIISSCQKAEVNWSNQIIGRFVQLYARD